MAAPKKSLPTKQIAKAYAKGDTLAEIGRRHSADPRTVRRVLIDAGVPIRPKV